MDRLRIRILSQNDVVSLVNSLNTWTDKFILESEDDFATFRSLVVFVVLAVEVILVCVFLCVLLVVR